MRADVSRPDIIKNIMRGLIIFGFLLLSVGLYGENYPSEGVVKKIIDGDTIELSGGETVRYIGIDTPETPYSRRGPEAFWKEATDANRRFVGGKIVKLKYDSQVMHNNRLLAYVYDGEIFVNGEMVRKGFALYSPFDPNSTKNTLLFQYENEARKNKLGIWALPLKNPAKKYIASNPNPKWKKEGEISKFHHVECPHAKRIADKNKMVFRSIDEALDEVIAHVGHVTHWNGTINKNRSSIPLNSTKRINGLTIIANPFFFIIAQFE